MANRCALAVVLALCASLVAAAGAPAAPQTLTRFVPSVAEGPLGDPSFSFSGPGLAGDSVAWARALPGGRWLVESGTPGVAPSRVARTRRPAAQTHVVGLIGASPTRIAWSDLAWNALNAHDGRSQMVRDDILATDLSSRVTSCGESGPPCCTGYCLLSRSADLDGDVLAYAERTDAGWDMVVDDLTSTAPPMRLTTERAVVPVVRVAGRYVAFMSFRSQDGAGVVVHDWRSGAEVYRVELRFLLDLQADGKVVTSGTDRALSWSSPAEPQPHRILNVPDSSYLLRVAMAGDRLAIIEQDDSGDQRVVSVSLDGERRVVAQSRHRSQRIFGGLAFDGDRVAWTALECGLVSVVLEPDAASSDGSATPTCTPPKLREFHVSPAGDVVAHVVCAAGCRGRLSGYFATDPRTRFARRTIALPPSPTPTRIVLRPSAAARPRLRRRTVRVQLLFSGRDGRGNLVGASRAGTLKRP